MKIVFIGSGSIIFVKNLIGDCLLTPCLSDAEYALLDIDAEKLALSERMLQRLNESVNSGRAHIRAYTSQKEALRGADFVISAIQVGGYRCVVPDFEIPAKYGLKQTYADTLGIGGIFRGLRTVPVMQDIVRDMMEVCRRADMDANPAWQYAAARHALYQAGKRVEVLAGYEPSFRFFAEWWKQLYGESEGKEHKGLFPASVEFTADLHSMGQYIQQGERLLFETVVRFARSRGRIAIPHDPENVDGLNFLSGKDLEFVSRQAMRGVTLAHVDGGVPNLALTVPGRDARSVGALIYFFEYACGLSGYLLGVNPFDQPGVEAYKNNMYALLGKPGYEARRAELEARL